MVVRSLSPTLPVGIEGDVSAQADMPAVWVCAMVVLHGKFDGAGWHEESLTVIT